MQSKRNLPPPGILTDQSGSAPVLSDPPRTSYIVHSIANFISSLKMNKNVKAPEISVKNITMWHTVAHINHDNEPCNVEITTDPYDHVHKAAVILHKTRSKDVAAQVARFVRRALELGQVTINRSNYPRDAKIGYAVSNTLQYAPNERTPCQDLVKKISITPVRELLAESDKSNNSARSRYFVLEVRSG